MRDLGFFFTQLVVTVDRTLVTFADADVNQKGGPVIEITRTISPIGEYNVTFTFSHKYMSLTSVLHTKRIKSKVRELVAAKLFFFLFFLLFFLF